MTIMEGRNADIYNYYDPRFILKSALIQHATCDLRAIGGEER